MYCRIIPSLLLHKGRLVKGNYQKNYKDAGNPVTTVKAHCFQGADEIIITNLDRRINRENKFLLEKICAETTVPISYFGGINNLESFKSLIKIGFDRVGLNSILFEDCDFLKDITDTFGEQSIIVGIDLKSTNGSYKILNPQKNKTLDIDIKKYINEIEKAGVGEFRFLNTDAEGNLDQIKINLLKYIKNTTSKPLIYEVGISNLIDLHKVFNEGILSVALGTMLVFSDYNIIKVKKYLKEKNFKIRV